MAVTGLVRKSLKKKSVVKSTTPKKKLTHFKSLVLSRHPSHSWFKDNIGLFPFRSIVRLGSTTSTAHVYQSRPAVVQSRVVECNTVQSIKNSANKRLMKECFNRAGVKTAEWTPFTSITELTSWSRDRYPIVAKHQYGSRGTGNYLLKSDSELATWLRNKANLGNYIFEKYYNFTREYRLHVTKDGCFYTCRKMLKEETPEDKRWFRNDTNCHWYMENNPGFNKPKNWSTIEADCIKALKGVGLDIGCFDVKVQSDKDKKDRDRSEIDYIIIESGSAPSFGSVTQEKYLEQVPKVLRAKYTQQ